MSGIFKISDAAALGLHALAYLALESDRRATTHEMAEALQVSEAHLAKVMQRLERAGLLYGKRGPAGGFLLSRPSEQTSLLEIYEAIEGPAASQQCLLGQPLCNGQCPLGHLFQRVEKDILQKMSAQSLAGFAQSCGVRRPHAKGKKR